MKKIDLVIIGGGPAGLATAISAFDNGVKDILIIERENRLGGILVQCIHNGFGLHTFKESLTGPEYAYRYIKQVEERKINYILSSTVLDISKDKKITYTNSKEGLKTIQAKAIVLAMGCRERSRGALNIPGTRPAGIYSAGTAQKYINIKGYMPGKNVVILGSGDIGLIMARRMTLEGASVKAVCEIMPYSSGLRRNIEQCLNDFNIPLYLSHTITNVEGKDRVSGVTISKVDQNKKPIPDTEIHFDCDTILFSVGLIPENELSKSAQVELSPRTKGAKVDQNRQTNVKGIFACGNVLHVHDLVDYVSEESTLTGKSVANYLLNKFNENANINVNNGENVGYVVPQRITDTSENVKFFFRTSKVMKNCKIKIIGDGKEIVSISKTALTPGEMQTVILKSDILKQINNSIVIKVEE